MNIKKIKTIAKKFPFIVAYYRFIYRIYKEIILFTKLIKFHIRNLSFNYHVSISTQHIHILSKIKSPSLEQFFNQKTVKFKKGSYLYYLPPQDNLWFNNILKNYPKGSALKILKTSGKANERIYIRTKNKPISQQYLFPNSHEMLSSCNYLNTFKITPRIYDLAYIQLGKDFFPTFIVEHINGREPDYKECKRFQNRIKTLINKELLSIISVKPWHKTTDFSCPHCSGNLLINDNNTFYVDFQNFVINTNKAMKEESRLAKNYSHFGSKYFVRGGKYLYQSVPQYSKYGKRDTDIRWNVIEDMLSKSNLTLYKKVVFDIGCNIGMIIGKCLNSGAFWCVGWDRSNLISHTDRILSLLGYGRYNLYGADLDQNYQFHRDVPNHLENMVDDAFLFFLSMRAHIGFPRNLLKMPWRYMVYEDHQNEERNMDKYLAEIKKIIKIKVLGHSSITDADSFRRPLVLLEKL